jgi:hypothetical protein
LDERNLHAAELGADEGAAVGAGVWNWFRHGAPPGYRFVHDLPNKPLSDYDLENKRDAAKINKALELWFLWSFEEGHKPAAGGFCLDLRWSISGEVGEECDLDQV